MHSEEVGRQRALWRRAEMLALCTVLLAVALRLVRLTFQPLWADEGYSVYFASLDPIALARATAADIHPPLYYYILKAWMAVFGPGEFSIRLLSVFVGVLTAALMYALARRLFGQRVGLLAVLLLAISPFHIYYSQEVRMYSLAALLAVASTYCLVQAIDANLEKPRFLPDAIYVVITALALYNLYYAVFIPIAQTVYVIARYHRQRRLVLRWLVLQACVVLLYVPWIVFATASLVTYVAGKVAVEKYTPFDPFSFVMRVMSALGASVPSNGHWYPALAALPVLGLAALGARGVFTPRSVGAPAVEPPQANDGAAPPASQEGGTRGKTSEGPLWPGVLMVLLVVVPVLLGCLVNLVWPFHPVGFERLFLYCIPFLGILVALGLERILWPGAAGGRTIVNAHPSWALAFVAGTAALWAGVLLDFYATPRYPLSDYRPLVAKMATLAHPDDAVMALYPWQVGFVRSYFVGQVPTLYLVQNPHEWFLHPAVMRQDLDRLGRDYRRLWFPSYEGAGGLLEGSISSYLTDAAFPALAQLYGNSRLELFAFGAVSVAQQQQAAFGGTLVLETASVSLEPAEAGRGCARLELRWHASGSLPQQGDIALRLVDDAGRTWDRYDGPPRNGMLPFARWTQGQVLTDHYAVAISETTPPGIYSLMLAVFDGDAGRNLPLSGSGGQALGNEMEIGTVVVTRSTYHPPVQALALPQPQSVRWTGGPYLVGSELPARPLQPGHQVQLDMYWQTTAPMAEDSVLFVQVRDQANKIWGLYEGAAVAQQYPPSRWVPGETLRGPVTLLLAPDAPAGEYRIVVGWLKGRSKDRLTLVGGGTEATIGRAQVVTRPHAMVMPRPANPMDMVVGEDIQFLGFDAPAPAVAGGALPLTLYWRALGRMDMSYSVFVHMIDDQGHIVAQSDSEPGDGALPTTSWLPGEAITDGHRLDVPAGTPAGEYTLRTGIYDAVTGQRLPVRSTATGQVSDVIELGKVTITTP